MTLPSTAGCPPPLSPVKQILFDEETISKRVDELSRQISQDYAGSQLVVISVLKGALMFSSDLIRGLSLPLSWDFMALNRYEGRANSERVGLLLDSQEDIRQRHVLLVKDIVDTGLTLNYLVDVLEARCPRSISICTFLDRPDLRMVDIPIKYVGFHVSDTFLIGYGLDYRERFRSLPFVATVDPDQLAQENRERFEPPAGVSELGGPPGGRL